MTYAFLIGVLASQAWWFTAIAWVLMAFIDFGSRFKAEEIKERRERKAAKEGATT